MKKYKRHICYIITNETISPDYTRTMGTSDFWQMWKIFTVENEAGQVFKWFSKPFHINIDEKDYKDKYYGKPVFRDWLPSDIERFSNFINY